MVVMVMIWFNTFFISMLSFVLFLGMVVVVIFSVMAALMNNFTVLLIVLGMVVMSTFIISDKTSMGYLLNFVGFMIVLF